MSDAAATSYDEVPYGSHIFHYSHPDRLATMATLLGLTSPPVDTSRVLELGCGTGANLIAMAHALPGGRFVGLDLSPSEIAIGQDVVTTLALDNVELKALSLMDVDERFGQYDYVICHGVYSWVPPVVQDQILTICSRHLAPNGVAYVSYNTYPGWHMRGMVRDMMRFHVGRFDDPHVRVPQARALLAFLLESVGDRKSVFADVLRAEADMLKDAADAYIYHEHLEEVNHPLWFHEFAARAAAKGLQYLAEAQPALLPTNLSPRVKETFENLAVDLVHAEQYLDFVRNRTFRWTLLCHQGVAVKRPPSAKAVTAMRITGLAKPATDSPDLSPDVAVEFRTADGAGLTIRDPMAKAALAGLFDVWPQPVPFPELLARVKARVAADAEHLADFLLQCFLFNLVELHVHAPSFAPAAGDRPAASPLARFQAGRGAKVNNYRHRTVELGEFERQVLLLLDGRRDRGAVLDGLVAAVAAGDCELQKDGQPLTDPQQVRAIMDEMLDPILRRLARQALLTS